MRRQVFTIDHVLLDSYTTERALLIKFLIDGYIYTSRPVCHAVWYRLNYISRRCIELQRLIAQADLNR